MNPRSRTPSKPLATAPTGRQRLLTAVKRFDEEALHELIAAGAPWTGSGPELLGYDMTPLMWATMAGWSEGAEALIRSGSPMDERARNGQTAIDLVLNQCRPIPSPTLLTFILLDLLGDSLGDEPAHVAAQRPISELTALARNSGRQCAFLNRANVEECTLLGTMVGSNRIAQAEFLIAAGADIGVGDAKGHSALSIAISRSEEATASSLIALGADIHQEDPDGCTPIMLAVEFNRPEMAKLLLDAGADPRRPCSSGASALTVASRLPLHFEAPAMAREWAAMLDLREQLAASTFSPPLPCKRRIPL